jgi:hypothetical protein
MALINIEYAYYAYKQQNSAFELYACLSFIDSSYVFYAFVPDSQNLAVRCLKPGALAPVQPLQQTRGASRNIDFPPEGYAPS